MTEAEFQERVVDLQRAFKCEYSAKEVKVLWRRLKGVSVDRLDVAVEGLISTFKRRPLVADIFSALPPLESPPPPRSGEQISRAEARRFIAGLWKAIGLEPSSEKPAGSSPALQTRRTGYACRPRAANARRA